MARVHDNIKETRVSGRPRIATLHGCFAHHNEFVSELAAAFDCWHYLGHLGFVRSRLPGIFRTSSHSFSEITVHIAYQLHRSYVSLHTRMEIMDGAVVTASVKESEQGVRALVYRILPTTSKTQWPLIPPQELDQASSYGVRIPHLAFRSLDR
jgi:hypothetical protein